MNIKTNPSRNISVWLRMQGIWWENKFLHPFKHFQGQFKFLAIQAIASLCLSAKVNKNRWFTWSDQWFLSDNSSLFASLVLDFLAFVTFVLHNVNKMKFNFIGCLRCEFFICWFMHLALSSFIIYVWDYGLFDENSIFIVGHG